jgi:hypothetical protein
MRAFVLFWGMKSKSYLGGIYFSVSQMYHFTPSVLETRNLLLSLTLVMIIPVSTWEMKQLLSGVIRSAPIFKAPSSFFAKVNLKDGSKFDAGISSL